MAPLTNPYLVSMLRRNMTRAPLANKSLASRPAVMLQSLFNFLADLPLFLSTFVSSMFDRFDRCTQAREPLRQASVAFNC